MADPPTPPPLPPLHKIAANKKGSRLPPTSRFPVLVSGQVSFTTAAAIKDLEQVPQNVYRIQVELKPRTADSNFSDAPWTLVARHFLSTIQLYDDTAIFIRKKENTLANKISSPEELPENPELFERDYAYDVKMRSNKLVTFKIIIGTKLNFWKTFKDGQLYKKMVSNDWYVNYVRLENQGTVAAIGHLIYAHNRYVNQEDIIQEIKNLIYPTRCDQIDVRSTKSKEFYYEGKKKVRVFTRWITIDCPIDIANELSNLIMERWTRLKSDEKFENYNIKNTVYVPRHKGIVNFDARIANIGKQNEFLRTYKDVTVLSNIYDIDATFTYSKEMGNLFGNSEQVGHHMQLRSFLRSWEDNTTGKPAIIAIHRTNNNKEYSLLSGNENMESIHKKIRKFIDELSGQLGFQQVRVGGTKGTNNNDNYSDYIKSYAKENFTTSKKYNQRPIIDTMESEEEIKVKEKKIEENQWKSPPLANRRTKKSAQPSLTVNFNDQRLIQEYKHVLVGNSYNNNQDGIYSGQNNAAPTMGNNQGVAKAATHNNKIVRHEGMHLGEVTALQKDGIIHTNTIQKIIESQQFQATLAKAVAPQVAKQVTMLVEPTLKKIESIQSQVEELHDYVEGNANWQAAQTQRQATIQTDVHSVKDSVNLMQSTMHNFMLMFKERQEHEVGNKRPAPNITNEIPGSPTRRQRTSSTISQQSVNNTFTNDTNYDEASNPQHSYQNTFTTSDEEASTPMDAIGEGEGQ